MSHTRTLGTVTRDKPKRRLRPTHKLELEALEPRCLLAGDLYVDDDWVGLSNGTDPDGAGPATAIGTDAFGTIQAAIDVAIADDNVHVAEGTYAENLTIGIPLNLLGAGAATTTVEASGDLVGIDVLAGADNVSLDGFTLNAALAIGIQAADVNNLAVTNLVVDATAAALVGTAPNREFRSQGISLQRVTNASLQSVAITNTGAAAQNNPDTGQILDVGVGLDIVDSDGLLLTDLTLTGNASTATAIHANGAGTNGGTTGLQWSGSIVVDGLASGGMNGGNLGLTLGEFGGSNAAVDVAGATFSFGAATRVPLLANHDGVANDLTDEDNLAIALSLPAKTVGASATQPMQSVYFSDVVIAASDLDAAILAGDAPADAYLVDLANPGDILVGPNTNISAVLTLLSGTPRLVPLSGSYNGLTVTSDLVISGQLGGVQFIGASPALTVSAGQVVIENGVTFDQTSASPTILVEAGGNLTLVQSVVNESTSSDEAAIQVDAGGALDLTSNDNTINVQGVGRLFDYSAAAELDATGTSLTLDGGAFADNFAIEDGINHALDAGFGSGLVRFAAGQLFVTPSSGSIQAAITAAAAGDTIHVADGTYVEPLIIDRNVDIAAANVGAASLDTNAASTGIDVLGAATTQISGLALSNYVDRGIRNAGDATLVDLTLNGGTLGLEVVGGTTSLVGSTVNADSGAVVPSGTFSVSNSMFHGTSAVGSAGIRALATTLLDVDATSITGFEAGVDVDNAAALIQSTNFSGNTIGLLAQNGAVVDAGQDTPGVDFTGLGASAGGNDFSNFSALATTTAGAIVNLNPDVASGRQGTPADLLAQQNTFFSADVAQIESVIWHDTDDAAVAFVDYAAFADLQLLLDFATINEGETSTLTGSFSNVAVSHTVTVSWGDGQPDDMFVLPAGTNSFVVPHTYADDEDGPVNATVYPINVTVVEDVTAQSLVDSTAVTVNNVAPSVPLTGDLNVDEGTLYELTIGPVVDPGTDTIFAYELDWGDGTVEFVPGDDLTTSEVMSHTYEDGLLPPQREITIRVLDEDGAFADAGSLLISVNNVAPTAIFQGFGTVDEGDSTNVFFTAPSDPSLVDTAAGFRYAFDFDNDGTFEVGDGTYSGSTATSFAAVPSEFLADGPSTATIAARIIDKDGGASDYSVVLNIQNVVPIFDVGANATVDVGAVFARTVSFIDPGTETLAPAGWIVQVDYGEGAGFEPVVNLDPISQQFELEHSYSATGSFTVTVTIDDQDGVVATDTFLIEVLLPPLQVTSFTPAPNGFDVQFNRSIDISTLNLYDGMDAAVELPDVTLVGQTAGDIRGSIVWTPETQTLTFIASGGQLPVDDYTIRLISAADALQDVSGDLLDGDGDGMAGGDFVEMFSTEISTARVLQLSGNIVRGPGQVVDLTPADPADDPLTVRIDDAADVVAVDFDLRFDATYLDVSTASLAQGLPVDWSLTQNLIEPGLLRVTVSGTTPLVGQHISLVALDANVPTTATYQASHTLQLEGLRVNEQQVDALALRSLHKVAYLGDVNADATNSPPGSQGAIQAYGGTDGGLMSRVVVALDSGFDAHDWLDPAIVGDTTGDGTLSGLDAAYVQQKAVGIVRPELPDLPTGGFTLVNGGPGLDPTFDIAEQLPALAGTTVQVPLTLDVEAGAVVSGATYDIAFDDAFLTFTGIALGADWNASEWALTFRQNSSKSLKVAVSSSGMATSSEGLNEIAVLEFQVAVGLAGLETGIDVTATFPTENGLVWTSGSGSLIIGRPDGDFDDDGAYGCDDVDRLVEEIAAATQDLQFDLTQDGTVDVVDLDAWLVEAGNQNIGPGRVYLKGDASLDGSVDGVDFIIWNDDKFTNTPAWCSGDFNADGAVDGQDFIIWNDNKFKSSDDSVVARSFGQMPAFARETTRIERRTTAPFQPPIPSPNIAATPTQSAYQTPREVIFANHSQLRDPEEEPPYFFDIGERPGQPPAAL